MKRIWLLCVMLCLFITGCGASDNAEIKETEEEIVFVKKELPLKAEIKVEFDEAGNITHEYETQYDEKGRETYYREEDAYANVTKYEVEWVEDGNTSIGTVKYLDNGRHDFPSYIKYDVNENVVSTKLYINETLYEETNKEYKNGILIKSEFIMYYPDGEVHVIERHEYNEKEQEVAFYTYSADSKVEMDEEYVYETFNEGVLKKHKDNLDSVVAELYYDERGLLIYANDGLYAYKYEYDNYGNVIKEEWISSDHVVWSIAYEYYDGSEESSDIQNNETENEEGLVSTLVSEEGFEHVGYINSIQPHESGKYVISFQYATAPLNVPVEDVTNMNIGDEYTFSNGETYKVLDKTEEGFMLSDTWCDSLEDAFGMADVVYCLDESKLTEDGKNVRVYYYSRHSQNPMGELYRATYTMFDVTGVVSGDLLINTFEYGEIKISEFYEKLLNSETTDGSAINVLFRCDDTKEIKFMTQWNGAG